LAFVVALLSADYIRLLHKAGSEGILSFFRPFMLTLGLQVGTIMASIVYRAGASHARDSIESTAFAVTSGLFVLSLLQVVSLARSLLMHALARAEQLDVEGQGEQVPRIGRRSRP
jgi:hypothetical protein